MTVAEILRQRFLEILGVRIAPSWLEAAVTSASAAAVGGHSRDEIEAYVLHQLLHHDLRDVVRSSLQQQDDNTTRPFAPVTQLRQVIVASKQAPSYKATWKNQDGSTTALLLMVQIEEAVDVSLNAEARLQAAVNGQVAASTTKRVLQMVLSDGFACDDDDENECPLLMAMETSPLSNMPAHVPAGLKLLLHGPVIVRHGLLQLNATNCVVLGGTGVPHLVQHQQHAIQVAQQQAGLGVDVTLRALVGGPEAALVAEEDEQDVGEQASGDIVVMAGSGAAPLPQPPPRHGHNHHNPRLVSVSPPAPLSAAAAAATVRRPAPSQPQPLALRPAAAAVSATAPANPYAGSITAPASSHGATAPAVLASSSSPRANPYNTATSSAPQPARIIQVFPPASQSNPRLSPAPSTNPYQQRTAVRSPTLSHAAATTTTTTASSCVASSSSWGAPPPPPQILLPATNTTTGGTTGTTTASPSSTSANGGSTILNLDASSANDSANRQASLPDLAGLLQRAIVDEALYHPLETLSWRCQLQQVGLKVYFNIVKNKQTKCYEYVMDARLGRSGTAAPHETITCRIAHEILAPHFDLTAAEVKQMNKTDKTRAAEVTREAGRKISEDLRAPTLLELRLLRSAADFFRPNGGGAGTPTLLYGNDPVLYVMRKVQL